jgi:site-specific recombinase XerD
MVHKLGIRTRLHSMRHYSATELLASGVDLRTVAGRLGHGSGGAITLRVYAAWVAQADQDAARMLGARLPLPRPRPTSPE